MTLAPQLQCYPQRFRADFAKVLGDGDWHKHGTYARSCATALPGVDVVDVARALAQLSRLLTPVVVGRLVEDGHVRFVLPLFQEGWMTGSSEFLHLGLDLAECTGWEGHKQLVARLRRVSEYDSARFEVGLWAGGVRSGLSVRYFDPQQQPCCDLRYTDGTISYDIEAKSVDEAPSDRNSRELARIIDHCLLEFEDRLGGGFALVVIPDAAIVAAARREQLADFERTLSHPIAALKEWLRSALSPLALDVPAHVEGLGDVRLERDDSGSFGCQLVGAPRTDFFQEVCRALRPTRDANRQLAGSRNVRIVAVWTGSSTCPAAQAVDVARVLVATQEPAIANIDWIAFLNSHTRFGDWLTSVETLRVRPEATDLPAQIKAGLINWKRCT